MKRTSTSFKKVLALVLFFSILVGMFVSLPAAEAEAASKITRMNFIKKVVTAMGLDYKHADAEAVETYKKTFSTTEANAKYISAAIDAGIITAKQWKNVTSKLTYKDMYIILVKADECLYGEWVSDEQANWIYMSVYNVRENRELTAAERTLLYKAFILGYAERYVPMSEKDKEKENYMRPCIKLATKVTTKEATKAIKLLTNPNPDWYTAFIPDTVQLKGTTPAQAYYQRVLETDAGQGNGGWADVIYFRPNMTVKAEWSSSNEKIVTIDENGVMTGKKAGTATITCKIRNLNYINTVTVKEPETKAEIMASYGARQALAMTLGLGHGDKLTKTKDMIQLSTFKVNQSGRLYPVVIGEGETKKVYASDINLGYSQYNMNVEDTKGYKWLMFPLTTYVGGMGTDSAYVDDGITFSLFTTFFDVYNREMIDDGDGKDSTFTINWNGKKWDKCEYHGRAEYVSGGSYRLVFFFKVPEGYDGLVLALGEYEKSKANANDGNKILKNCQIYVDVCE